MHNAIIAASVPTAILMVLLLTILYAYKDNPYVQGMSKGVIPVAGVMIGTLAWGLIRLSDKLMGWMPTIILSVVSLIVMEVFNVHPAFLDRKSTRLNSSHVAISYAVFCLKKKII